MISGNWQVILSRFSLSPIDKNITASVCYFDVCNLFVSVLESFRDYVTVESLDGDNKYDAGEHGLQVFMLVHSREVLSVKFSYPSVLTYVLGAQKNCLIEKVLLSTYNICFG